MTNSTITIRSINKMTDADELVSTMRVLAQRGWERFNRSRDIEATYMNVHFISLHERWEACFKRLIVIDPHNSYIYHEQYGYIEWGDVIA